MCVCVIRRKAMDVVFFSVLKRLVFYKLCNKKEKRLKTRRCLSNTVVRWIIVNKDDSLIILIVFEQAS